MYKAQLNKLRGKYIPYLPSAKGPPQSGDVHGTRANPHFYYNTAFDDVLFLTIALSSLSGYRFLVMERMDAPLFDVIPRLLAGKRLARSGKIPFGNVASALLDCLEALHDETGFLFVDVKPENFMLSQDGKTLAEKIRMIDFALIQLVRGIDGRRPNEGTSSIVGTPLYSSLNVHDGQTHSRRDDLEALGYVVGELLIKLIAAANGGDANKAHLPWSDGTSDEHIGKLKKKELTSTKSAFF
jgi:serine/threonine protein kinase